MSLFLESSVKPRYRRTVPWFSVNKFYNITDYTALVKAFVHVRPPVFEFAEMFYRFKRTWKAKTIHCEHTSVFVANRQHAEAFKTSHLGSYIEFFIHRNNSSNFDK